MPNTTIYEFGDIVLVPFPYSDLHTSGQRPGVVISTTAYNAEALVVSSAAYHQNRLEVILVVGITGTPGGDIFSIPIEKWREAGLLKSSTIKPVIQSVTQNRVIQRLGKLSTPDKNRLRKLLVEIIALTPVGVASSAPAPPSGPPRSSPRR